MSKTNVTVLKIGGSVITDKNGELAARTQIIDRLADEIQKAGIENLVIIHGGGSFGHPAAKEYALKEGLKNANQLIGFAETHHFMTVLNGLVMDSLIMHKVPAVSITPSSCVTTEKGRIRSLEDAPLRMLMKMGFVPVLYGDAVVDTQLGFTILSGDQLVSALAVRFNAERIIIGADVDGLYNADPKTQGNAKLFQHLTLNEVRKLKDNIARPTANDVTGGMFGKVAELLPAVEQGIPISIVNATKPNYIYKALRGDRTEGTLIEKE